MNRLGVTWFETRNVSSLSGIEAYARSATPRVRLITKIFDSRPTPGIRTAPPVDSILPIGLEHADGWIGFRRAGDTALMMRFDHRDEHVSTSFAFGPTGGLVF
ncbi:hypothetical protein DV706_17570 (plasmid) [Natronorubrum bangense]|uniref:Uncharacterized protein n=2 Tax=Natronorubrum bangense TaxID=61858 RepID=L9WAX9_9EURY|nr:hypothetical protein C494_14323 [Natronorubrum bangense JCM 10635]QCC56347.1 hypothetical protein DV706_17570 [Natronorubrum bangense]